VSKGTHELFSIAQYVAGTAKENPEDPVRTSNCSAEIRTGNHLTMNHYTVMFNGFCLIFTLTHNSLSIMTEGNGKNLVHNCR
jgi:hypothetical protein